MALRLLLSASLASLVVVGCPLSERSVGSWRVPAATAPAKPPALLRHAAQHESLRPSWQSGPGIEPSNDEQQLIEPVQLTSSALSAPAGERVTAARPLHEELLPERTLGALSKQTVVHAAPRRSSRKLGFLRQGALVRRSVEPDGHEGCEGGWYRVAPEGYVCIGKTATLDLQHPLLQLAERRPDRTEALPYQYGRARFPTPPLYTTIPSETQQQQVELDLVAQRRRVNHFRAWDALVISELPDFLQRGERVPRPFGYPVLERDFVSGQALPETGFAFLRFYEHEGRRFGLTTDLNIVPLDRVEPVTASEFHGIRLSESVRLPVAFVRTKGASLYRGDPKSTGLSIERPLQHREAVPITDEQVRLGSGRYIKTQTGGWILDKHLVKVNPMKSPPSWAKGSRSWIEVSILDQTLVAYVGDQPVYTTLVSTGVGGLGDPKETHATIRGTFLIHTKHVTATMSSDEVGDEFDLRDVPYVQYFQDGYAFHAAYWHDSFGQPRSHGCINLSPADARWLFHWSAPAVPRAWHSSLSLKDGTLVYIHP